MPAVILTTLAGILMVAITFAFWFLELREFVHAIKEVHWKNPKPKSQMFLVQLFHQIKINFGILCAMPLLMPFVIDMVVTIFLVESLGMGGVAGGLIGMFMSDLFSILIIATMASIKAGRVAEC
jgi:hypothetical protein